MRRTTRFTLLVATLAAISVSFSGIVLADTIHSLDGSTELNGNNITYTGTTDGNSSYACSKRGTAVTGSGALRKTNSGTQFANAAVLTVTGSSVESGITVAQTSVTLPSGWTSASTGTSVAFSVNTTTANTVPHGTHTVTLRAEGAVAGGGMGFVTGTFTVTVNTDCTVEPSDTTPPVVTATITGTIGNNGWYTSSVTLSWSATDAQSAISSSSGCDTVNITADQADATYTCTATSAGGTTRVSRTIKRDATAPVVTPTSVNNTTWRRTPLAEAFSASDAMSGLATTTDASFTLTASLESTRDANGSIVGTSVSKTVTDAAGNSTTRSVSALIDLTGPVISGSDLTNTTWRNTPLTHSFTASDVLSGLASSTDGSFNLSASAESVNATTPTTVSKTVADVAGNTSTRSVSALIDLTKPTSEVAGVTEGAVYFAAPTVTCPANDSLSGVASAGTPSGDTTTAGSKSVTCNGAVDNAGNAQTVTSGAVNYVLAPIGSYNSNFDGSSAVLKVKPNQAIPLKWAFSDGTTNYAALSTASLSSVSSTRCDGGLDSTETATTESASGASGLQLLPDNSYQMNWKASSTTGCRALTMTMNFSAGGSTSRMILVNITK